MTSHLNPIGKLRKAYINVDSSSNENVPLLGQRGCHSWSTLRHRYKSTRKCISSKAALAILMWGLTMSMLCYLILNPGNYTKLPLVPNTSYTSIVLYGITAIILCLYPIAGYIADNKYSRFKTAIVGLWILVPSSILFLIDFLWGLLSNPYFGRGTAIALVVITMVSAILLTISSVIFNANVIQLGVDQLYDFPAEDQSLFIHWYFWVFYLGVFLAQFTRLTLLLPTLIHPITNNSSYNYLINIGNASVGSLEVVVLVLLIASLLTAHCKKNWFLIEPCRVNPYKLVYKVTKFAWRHKVPVRRSAFTYCEDDIPSGLDLAKEKYGGPFTIEQVEDVKVFYGILKVLFSLGPVFFLTFGADETLYQFTLHGSIFITSHGNSSTFNSDPLKVMLIQYGLLTPLVTIICIPLYLFLLRPLFVNYIPGMLKRIGIGAAMLVLSLTCTLVIGAWAHTRYDVGCMFYISSKYVKVNNTLDNSLDSSSTPQLFYDPSLVIIQRVLQSFSDMFLYIALYEFICSQSPHSMKGLLIGLSFAIKGLFNAIAAVLALPFALSAQHAHISCGVSYHIMNVGVGVIAMLVYTCVARRYKNRERDEPSNIYMYAENYYSKGPPDE